VAEIATITYRLPYAELLVTGTVRRRLDTVLHPNQKLADATGDLAAHAVELRHAGGDELTLRIPGGWLRSYKGTFAFTADRRLTQAVAETTGEAGTVLASAATLTGAVLGIRVLARKGVVLGKQPIPPPDPIQQAFAKTHPDLAGQRDHLAELHADARTKILEAAELMLEHPDDKAVQERLRTLREGERVVKARLETLDAQFAAWRASTIREVEEHFGFIIPVKDLPTTVPPQGWGAPGSVASARVPTTLRELWERFGMTVTASFGAGRQAAAQQVGSDADRVSTRRPYEVVLSVVEQVEGVSVVTSSSRHLIADDHSIVESFRLHRSLWGRRSLNLSFDGAGLLAGIGVEGAAALGAAATAAAALPAGVAGGLDTVAKAAASLNEARQAAMKAELSRVRQEVELRQQQLLGAGLDATAVDAARLKRLEQLKAILVAQTAIRGADPPS
jgi:hypothetical protein